MPERPNVKPVPNLPQFRWNERANQYIGPDGRFVSRVRIRGALDTFIDGTIGQMDDLAARLARGDISLAQWQTQMMALSKDANLAGAALERGGWYQLGPEDFGHVGQKMRGEYAYLRDFAQQIEDGLPLDGKFRSRAKLYGEQGRMTYYDSARRSAMRDGFTEERSVLNPGESCEECVSEDAAGWRPIGAVVPIGERECLSNCNCSMQYRKGTETRTV